MTKLTLKDFRLCPTHFEIFDEIFSYDTVIGREFSRVWMTSWGDND